MPIFLLGQAINLLSPKILPYSSLFFNRNVSLISITTKLNKLFNIGELSDNKTRILFAIFLNSKELINYKIHNFKKRKVLL